MGATQAKAETKDKTQDAPILRLYHDLWLHLCHYLDARSLANLIFTGNPTIASHVVRNTRSTRFHGGGLIWNLKPLLNFSKRFQSIQELIISTKQMTCLALKPNTTLTLPPTLTTLDLSFYGIFSAIQPIRLSQAVPVLTRLSLDNHGSRKPHMLSDFDLPLSLQTLCLECDPAILGLTPQGIAQLPRTLTDLSIAFVVFKRMDEGEGFNDRFDSYLWPLSLTSCRLVAHQYNLMLKHLPRTVTRLDLSRCTVLQTHSGQFGLSHFPWRVFFPRLRNISLPNQFSRTSLSGHLQSLIMPRFMDETKVESFMNSGFWLLSDELGPIWKDTYPSYELIVGTETISTTVVSEEEVEMLIPHLKQTCLPGLPLGHPLFKHVLPFKEFTGSCNASEGDEPLPHEIRTLNTLGSTVHARLLPPLLTSLDVVTIIGNGSAIGRGYSEGDLPVSLLSLTMRGYAGPDLLSILPQTLTHLTATLHCASEWNLLAARLVSLSKLEVLFGGSWNRSDPLMPIMSDRLSTLSITACLTSISPVWPTLHQFFPNRSIFPPSLTKLSLRDQVPILGSLFAALPRSLLDLKISDFTWTVPQETVKKTPRSILRSLPPQLRTLILLRSTYTDPISWEDLRDLPRSMLCFSVAGHILFAPGPDAEEDLLSVLPPYLLAFKRDPDRRTGYAGFVEPRNENVLV